MNNLESNAYRKTKFYVNVNSKFIAGHIISSLWLMLSIYLSLPWLSDLTNLIGFPAALLIISGIGYMPGYINMFTIVGLLLDRQPETKQTYPKIPVTVLIACRNEAHQIGETLLKIAEQDYQGHISIIVIDNASTDQTAAVSAQVGESLQLDLQVISQPIPGKFNALNLAVNYVQTDYVITLDADTLLHRFAINKIVSRMLSSPENVCAVAGAVLVRNSRENMITKLQEWDYYLGIASIKRLQGLYQSTLVAQGAFSLYKTKAVKEAGLWPDAIGEDIVLTWNMLQSGYKVYFEPLAVAFTAVPSTLKHLTRQRSRWARGMIEALKLHKPWENKLHFTKFLTGINLIMPLIDLIYTLCFIPGIILALFGHYWIVGPMTLLVIPLALIQNRILYGYQKKVFKNLDLKVRSNRWGYLLYIMAYQFLMSPISLIGYTQEVIQTRRKW